MYLAKTYKQGSSAHLTHHSSEPWPSIKRPSWTNMFKLISDVFNDWYSDACERSM